MKVYPTVFIKGTNSIATGSTTLLSSTTSAQSAVQQMQELHNTGMTRNNLNASYLIVDIGFIYFLF